MFFIDHRRHSIDRVVMVYGHHHLPLGPIPKSEKEEVVNCYSLLSLWYCRGWFGLAQSEIAARILPCDMVSLSRWKVVSPLANQLGAYMGNSRHKWQCGQSHDNTMRTSIMMVVKYTSEITRDCNIRSATYHRTKQLLPSTVPFLIVSPLTT